MNRGILYVSFGKSCNMMAAHTIAYSRRFTDLPICVLTNVENRDKKWNNIPDVSFIEVEGKIEENRDFKTRMNEYTPFDETLYIDCDSVIQNLGIEEVFECLSSYDMVLNLLYTWTKGEKIIRLYRNALRTTGNSLPLLIYNGAFICFKKNSRIDEFFSIWNKNWKITGSGREMPALACSIKETGIKVEAIRTGFFSPDYYKPESIVQHNYNPAGKVDFWRRFDIPHVYLCKSFDKESSVEDWKWVDE